jgi:glutathione S-transferase
MLLIGMLDSPYVRRVAITLKLLGIPFEHRALSVFRHYEEFARINPVVKAPTLVTDDGTMLIDSTLIIDYAETLAASGAATRSMAGADELAESNDGVTSGITVGRSKGISLTPSEPAARLRSLSLTGLALVACEKTMQTVYETQLRPADKQHVPWLERVRKQLDAAYDALDIAAAKAQPWLIGTEIAQADVSVAVAWRFTQFVLPEIGLALADRHPALVALSARAEALPVFASTPLD